MAASGWPRALRGGEGWAEEESRAQEPAEKRRSGARMALPAGDRARLNRVSRIRRTELDRAEGDEAQGLPAGARPTRVGGLPLAWFAGAGRLDKDGRPGLAP